MLQGMTHELRLDLLFDMAVRVQARRAMNSDEYRRLTSALNRYDDEKAALSTDDWVIIVAAARMAVAAYCSTHATTSWHNLRCSASDDCKMISVVAHLDSMPTGKDET